jgi:DNA-binding NarL/FixJ family response regulator
MKSLRILLVDDHEVVRMGLSTLLDDIPDTKVIGEAGSGAEAITFCSTQQPDVVIMDIRMPEMSGIEACRGITTRWPTIQVIMLTSFAEDGLIADAIRAGAVGYVLKQVGNEELIHALNAVREGAALLDPSITRRLLTLFREQTSIPDPFHELTERELAVLKLLSMGKSNAQIAEVLVLSDKTVRNHVSVILSKLSVENRVEAATLAVKHNIHTYSRK